MSTLSFGPLDDRALMVSVDMQRLFLEEGDWYCEAGLAILSKVEALARRGGNRCLHTRFITPHLPDEAEGQWAHYYRHWRSVTQSVVGAEAMRLHKDLEPLADPGTVFDKTGHDAFHSTQFADYIDEAMPSALVVFGIETDVCVLATVLSAVDRGIRVLIPVDAVASSDTASHQACLDLIYPRFDQQIELLTTADVLTHWVDR